MLDVLNHPPSTPTKTEKVEVGLKLFLSIVSTLRAFGPQILKSLLTDAGMKLTEGLDKGFDEVQVLLMNEAAGEDPWCNPLGASSR